MNWIPALHYRGEKLPHACVRGDDSEEQFVSQLPIAECRRSAPKDFDCCRQNQNPWEVISVQKKNRTGLGITEMCLLDSDIVDQLEKEFLDHDDVEGFYSALAEAAVRERIMTTGNISGYRIA